MKDPLHHDPIDILGQAYEKMYERAAENFHNAEEKSAPLIHRLIDEAKEKAVKLEEISEEDGEKLSLYLKRDLSDAASYLLETGHELEEWLGFETSQLKTGIFDLLLKAADDTTLRLLQMKEVAQLTVYHTGEITGPGTLVCDQCSENLQFHRAAKIPPCPKCHATSFHRNINV